METQNKTLTKTISVLLTRYTDPFSKIMRVITRCRYTHASIGIGDAYTEFFSFNTKRGFCIENLIRKKRDADCMLYQLRVDEESYLFIQNRIQDFINCKQPYTYSYLGLLLCLLHIPHRSTSSYFCSQFVSELLQLSGAMKLKRPPSLYLPKHFFEEPGLQFCYQGTLKELAVAF